MTNVHISFLFRGPDFREPLYIVHETAGCWRCSTNAERTDYQSDSDKSEDYHSPAFEPKSTRISLAYCEFDSQLQMRNAAGIVLQTLCCKRYVALLKLVTLFVACEK